MSSTATPLGLNKQGSGDNNNTWGDVLNAQALDLIDEAIRGMAAFALTGTYTLDATNYVSNQARCMLLHATSGTGGTVIIPSISKLYVAWNQTSGTMEIKTSGGTTTATLDPDDLTVIFCDGAKTRQLMIGGYTFRDFVSATAFGGIGTLPAQTGNAGKVIKTDGVNATWQNLSTSDIADYARNVIGITIAFASVF